MTPVPPPGIADTARQLRDGTATSEGLVEGLLAEADRLDPSLGVYVRRFDESVLAAARSADRELAAGRDRGPLHGVPVAVKDVIASREAGTTAQSRSTDGGWYVGRDSAVVATLRARGACIIGKTSTMEFSCGMPHPDIPPLPRNPWEPTRWTGGSSSGSAAGVAAGLFPAALGTDTGASVRMPAAFCGVAGLKPTHAAVPTEGVIPLAASLDHVGFLARTVADCRLLFQPWSCSVGHEGGPERPEGARPLAGLRVGVDVASGWRESAHPGVRRSFERAIGLLADLGADVVEIELPHFAETTVASQLIRSCEALAHHRDHLAARWSDIGQGARTLMAQGALVAGADLVDAWALCRLVRARVTATFVDLDAIVMPTAGSVAPAYEDILGDDGLDSLHELLATVYTAYWNALGNPVLAVPTGFSDGLPVSMQIIGPSETEERLLLMGEVFEAASASNPVGLPTEVA